MEPYLPRSGTAVELGFGSGNGVAWLCERGFEVIGIDIDPLAIETTLPRIPNGCSVQLIECDMCKSPIPDCDVLVASWSLFFVPKSRFPRLWRRIKQSVKPGGLIAINLLGPRDEWNDGARTIHTSRGAKALLRGFEVLYWEEAEREGTTVTGAAKYWHAFHVVARKRQ